jgi:hypothetical protein
MTSVQKRPIASRRSASLSGFLEMDLRDAPCEARRLFLVAHCGESAAGEYLHTLSAVDVATGWCELEVLPNRSQQAVTEALELMRARLPFPLLGIDSDNDSAFINANLLRYCEEKNITFTRCRPGKNDQAHVEQKNWTVVRKLLGYDRYECVEACELVRAIYADWRLVVNFFQPVRKLLEKKREGSKVRKKYDVAKTPYQRVLASSDVGEEEKEKLREIYQTLNPVELRHRIEKNMERLRRLHG